MQQLPHTTFDEVFDGLAFKEVEHLQQHLLNTYVNDGDESTVLVKKSALVRAAHATSVSQKVLNRITPLNDSVLILIHDC